MLRVDDDMETLMPVENLVEVIGVTVLGKKRLMDIRVKFFKHQQHSLDNLFVIVGHIVFWQFVYMLAGCTYYHIGFLED